VQILLNLSLLGLAVSLHTLTYPVSILRVPHYDFGSLLLWESLSLAFPEVFNRFSSSSNGL
jgi:hypothetical protein